MLLFADLHCSPKTLDICLDVLRGIHELALKNNEEVGMLGDFFDTVYRRGTIPVDMLNTLLDFFAFEWKVHMVMIPGNHDYIDANETEHALDPFRHTNDKITVLDVPTIINNVLWVPWKRNNEELKEVFKKFEGQYNVIFGHFDVIGAHVNSNVLSDRGLSPSDFPTTAITGHYHRPQKIGPVYYIGSPYQTSMAEAGQKKRFLRYIPAERPRTVHVSYGPKRFKVTEDPDTWPANLQPGDIVYIDSYTPEKLTPEAQDWVDQHRTVNFVLQRSLKDINHSEMLMYADKPLTPEEMFVRYATHFNFTTEVGYEKGLHLIRSFDKNNLSQLPAKLIFSDIKFEGFGPFYNANAINLHKRGLTKVTGIWKEGQIGSSNGAGKSMATVSAFLWCFTGNSDIRATTSMKHSQASSECINVDKGECRVEVSGFLADKPFSVIRTVSTIDKTNFLEFFLDSQRHTKSTQVMTQRCINSTLFRIPSSKSLGKSPKNRLHAWLMRTVVWEQSGNNRSWLSDNDKQTKEDLLMLCDMNVWEDILQYVGDKIKATEEQIKRTRDLHVNSVACLNSHQARLEQTVLLKRKWTEQLSTKIKKYTDDIEQLVIRRGTFGPEPVITPVERVSNKRKYEEITHSFCSLKSEKEKTEGRVLKFYKTEEDYKQDLSTPEYEGVAPLNLHAAIEELGVRKQQLKLLKKLAAKPTNCPTCKQALCVKTVSEHDLEKAESDHSLSTELVQQVHKKIKIHDQNVNKQVARREHIKLWERLEVVKNEYCGAKSLYDTMMEEKQKHRAKEEKWAAEVSAHSTWKSAENEIRTRIAFTTNSVESLRLEKNPHDGEELNIVSLIEYWKTSTLKYQKQLASLSHNFEELRNIKLWFGTKGVQTYIVEGILFKMSTYTTDWCKRLFDEKSLGAPVFKIEINDDESLGKTIQFGESINAKALSGGQYRRLQIAAFMAWRTHAEMYTGIHTNLLLLDEPAANIDIIGFRQMEQALKDWCVPNKTCLFISHDVDADKESRIYDTHLQIIARRNTSEVIDLDNS